MVSLGEFYVSFSVLVLDIPSPASGLQELSEHAKSPGFLQVSGPGFKTLVCTMSFEQGHLEMWLLYWLYRVLPSPQPQTREI